MRAIVIGCGVIGASVAAALAGRGADVTVLEARRPGAGSSGATLAWVNANAKRPRSYFDLNVAGMRAHCELARGGGDWFVRTGNLEWATDETQRDNLRARVDQATEWGYQAKWMTRAEALALEPDLRLPGDAEIVYFPEEGYCAPIPLLARLLGAARDAGAVVVAGTAARSVRPEPGGVRVDLADGTTLAADVAVSCTGRWTERLVASAGGSVPMLGVKGPGSKIASYLAETTAVPARLSRVVISPALNIRPDGGGRLLMQAADLDATADPAAPPSPSSPVAARLLARLGQVLAGTEAAAISSIRIGLRSVPADDLTVAGPLDPAGQVYVVATHSGITLAPALGPLVAAEIYGEPSPLLADFRPGRFARSR